MDQKTVINILSNCYKNEKRKLIDSASGNNEYSEYVLKTSKKICDTLEKNVTYLKDDDYFIIYNEVIKGKKGRWYQGYLSESSYYRHRKVAYRKYIRSLNVIE